MDTRAAVTYVERGLVDCGIVYRTDAMISKKVSVTFELPKEIQPEICYPVSALSGGKHQSAESFMAFLKSQTARQIFVNNGFEFCFAELQNE